MYSRVLLSAALLAAMPLMADKIRLAPGPTNPAATGEVNVGTDRNGNTEIELSVERLARPAALSPPRATYIVWTQAPNGQPENHGELKVDNNLNGSFKTVTPLRNFDVFITAEDDPRTTTPKGPVVLRGTVAR